MLTLKENHGALAGIDGRGVEKAMVNTKHRRVILDTDSSESIVLGEQEGLA